MYRSETMAYYRMVFSKESEWKMLEKLGRLGFVQLENLNHLALHASRPFESQIKDVNSRLDKVKEIESILIAKGYIETKEEFNESFNSQILKELDESLLKESHSKFYCDLFDIIDAKYFRIKEQLDQISTIDTKIETLTSAVDVLRILKKQLPESFAKYARPTYSGNLNLDYFAGTIDLSSVLQVQKALFRITRGNAYITYTSIGHEKCCVFIAVQSTGSGQIRDKINRICQSMTFSMISVPNDANDLEMTLALNRLDLEECYKIKEDTRELLLDVLNLFSSEDQAKPFSYIYQLKTLLLKHLCLLENMNSLVLGKTFTSGCFWLPESKTAKFQFAINDFRAKQENESLMIEKLDFVKLKKIPPTRFRTKGFFDSFQTIVDTYGIARYKEANPGLFTSVTFPFLFGCMFGDIGHGLGVLIFGILLCTKPTWFSRQMVSAKYIFLFMGIFAFWCGLIYNDFFAVPMLAFNSCYTENSQGQVLRKSNDCIYPIGLDFIWSQSKNSVPFLNSFKMKISIIYGVTQMVLGIIIKGTNSVYFGNMPEFFTEFIPQLLFMLSTFGYMVFCIIVKWFNEYSADTSKAPSIIAIFIGFVGNVDNPLYSDSSTQMLIQQVLALIAVFAIPIMLFGKPIILHFSKKKGKINDLENEDDKISLMSHEIVTPEKNQSEEHDDMTEAIIHQGIETIEFVLGSVSNTASYLRIWALSLAHSQLAKVFLDLLLGGSIIGANSLWKDVPTAILMFIALMIVTIGVLMFMDLLECFLHTLRLHWVEFQSKFYKGDGQSFRSFSFQEYVDMNMA